MVRGLSMPNAHPAQRTRSDLAGVKIETVQPGLNTQPFRQALGHEFFIAGGWAVLK